ncbi:protease S8 tripeptidyl peptidase I [Penicillium samsonianum]|uniref:protease S8 tripeptidyl peptidase I n=1 Tax=Penicillium samsonianum TaxID=1882272 RepID=UPI002548CF34|nr:protease S8 tripeptidyl peptidase I [Penicillium samsonianum]KAJ6139488.1 protease S8 tripeptidyl peptidase I [Penicillium samsonianum]
MSKPPTVLVIPYGFNENQFAENSAKSFCNFGDGGVGGSSEGNNHCTASVPTFPATCPYVTVVGGTQQFSPEVSASFSAGGFSNYVGRPSYQNNAVSAYLQRQGGAHVGRYNPNGRAYPDVSAQAANIVEVKGERGILVQSMSAAAMIFASTISLLNGELITAGRRTMEFLNPWLYSNPGVLNDITSGSNPGCNTPGFPATPGWDAVTRLGSPSYQRMKASLGL